MECSICLSPINDDDATSKTVCGHTFHSKCIFTSIAYHNFSCPNCREKLTDFPEKVKESETDAIIRSIIEIHNIPNIIGNEQETLEQEEQTDLSRGEEMHQNISFINEEHVQFFRSVGIDAPRNVSHIGEGNMLVNNGLRTRRFRRLPPILTPTSTVYGTNNIYNTSTNRRTIVSPPYRERSNIISLLFRSVNSVENSRMEDQD